MDTDPMYAVLRRILVNDLFVSLPEEQIGLDDDLQSKIGLDSIGFSELRILCERKFSVRIDDEDYVPDNFRSVRKVVALIRRLNGSSAV